MLILERAVAVLVAALLIAVPGGAHEDAGRPEGDRASGLAAAADPTEEVSDSEPEGDAKTEPEPEQEAELGAALTVRSNRPDAAASGLEPLRVRDGEGHDVAQSTQSLLRFDEVPAHPDGLATLHLRVTSARNAPVTVHRIVGEPPPDVSWNTRPELGEVVGRFLADGEDEWVEVPIGVVGEGTVWLALVAGSSSTATFAGAESAHPPRLVVGPRSRPEPTDRDPVEPPAPATPGRPYAADSVWNRPIPEGAVVHPASDALVGRVDGVLTSDASQYTVPVYVVEGGVWPVPVRIDWPAFSYVEDGGHTIRNPRPTLVFAPIPRGAQPAPGSDGHLVVVDRRTGSEWGFWQARQTESGAWTATNGYRYDITASGVPPEGFGSRGAGMPYLAGLLRPEEVRAGLVEHALAFGYTSASPDRVPPATKSDGRGEAGVDIPEGARLQLDPSLTVDDLRLLGLDDHAIVVAQALQDYGMYLVDVSGRTKIFRESEETADWEGLIHEQSLAPIPLQRFRVVLPPACGEAADLEACWRSTSW